MGEPTTDDRPGDLPDHLPDHLADPLVDLVDDVVQRGATEVAQPAISQPQLDVIAWCTDGRWFAAPAESVQEVVRKDAVVRVPALPEHIVGVALVRGRMVAVVDLLQLVYGAGAMAPSDPASALSIAASHASTAPRLVVLAAGDAEVAVVAQVTRGVVAIPEPRLTAMAMTSPCVVGEVSWQGGLVALVDADVLVASAREEPIE